MTTTAVLESIGRAISRQDRRMAELIMKNSELARAHIHFVGSAILLIDPDGFPQAVATAKASRIQQQTTTIT